MKLKDLALAIAPYASILVNLLKDVSNNNPETIQTSLAKLKIESQTIEAVMAMLASKEGHSLFTHLEALSQQPDKAVSSILQEEFEGSQVYQGEAALVELFKPSASIKVSIHVDEEDNTIFLMPISKGGNKETARIDLRSSSTQDRHVPSITLLKHALLNRLEPNMPLTSAYKEILDILDILLPQHLHQKFMVTDEKGITRCNPYYKQPEVVRAFYDNYKLLQNSPNSSLAKMSKASLEAMMEKLIEIYHSRLYLSMNGEKTLAELAQERNETKAAIETLCKFEWQLRAGVDYFNNSKPQQVRDKALALAKENAGILWNLGYKQKQIEDLEPLRRLSSIEEDALYKAVIYTFDYTPRDELIKEEISEDKKTADNKRAINELENCLYDVAAAHLALISVLTPKLYEQYQKNIVTNFIQTVAKQHQIGLSTVYAEVYLNRLVPYYKLGFHEIISEDYKIAQAAHATALEKNFNWQTSPVQSFCNQ